MAPSHYLNQCWLISNWTLRNISLNQIPFLLLLCCIQYHVTLVYDMMRLSYWQFSMTLQKESTDNAIPDSKSSWGQHGTHLGPVGPRWAPCWPYEPCYQGCFGASYIIDSLWHKDARHMAQVSQITGASWLYQAITWTNADLSSMWSL